jgi:hypothetical protein
LNAQLIEEHVVSRKQPALFIALISTLALLIALPANAQEPTAEELAKANNPLADMKAFNLQNYFIPSLTGTPDATANTFWLRYAQPVGSFLLRASLPLPTVPVSYQPDSVSGVGDFNLFAAYLAIQKPTSTLGIGPLLAAPSATDDALGSGKWQGGVATVFFNAPNPTIQYGGLLTWQASFAGDEERDNTNLVVAQPFFFVQLGGGTYLRTAPLWVFNIEQDTYHIPFGFGIGQVVKSGSTVYNVFVEPQFTMLHKGVGQPQFQVYMALNMQFGSN